MVGAGVVGVVGVTGVVGTVGVGGVTDGVTGGTAAVVVFEDEDPQAVIDNTASKVSP